MSETPPMNTQTYAAAIARATAAEDRVKVLEDALNRMLSEETDWDDGEIGVGHRFRQIARTALGKDMQ